MSVIKVENLSKLYNIGIVSSKTISQDINRRWAKFRGRDDPYTKIGRVNNINKGKEGDFIWALKDINFEVQKGEVVGIIGKNGAGKSTLLKILSRVTSPSSGSIKLKGRVASLLEIGTGFHPDLTGRENIFLNGSLLGMSRQEIKKKFEEILNFSGIDKYVDTPVKRYSSGMFVRLAFAVAAHLDPEILVVDEVLAVGDAEFQKKCLGKMKDVSKNEGRTILIVSHQMGIVSQLCEKSILLSEGKIAKIGSTNDVIQSYIQSISKIVKPGKFNSNNERNKIAILEVKTVNASNENTDTFAHTEVIYFKLLIKVNEFVRGSVLSLFVKDKFERKIFDTEIRLAEIEVSNTYVVKVEIPDNFLKAGYYTTGVAIHLPNIMYIHLIENACNFNVIDVGSEHSIYKNDDHGCVFVKSKWNIKKLDDSK